MAVLYPFRYLNHIDAENLELPLKRYLFKYENQRNEIAHLKHHEKDFLFRCLKVLRNETDERAYDLFRIPEAKEFLFDWIVLNHSNQIMVFDGPIPGPYGLLKPAEKRRNKRFFYEYLPVLKNQIQKGEGAYFSIIKPEIAKKIKGWEDWAGGDVERIKYLIKKTEYIYATFFHIYYHAKLFFDEKPKPYVIKRIGEFDVTFNVYSYVHILSRHYYPNMNKDIGITLNTELECLDLDYLPDEIMPLIEKHNQQCAITQSTEYLLYSYEKDFYILWLKYKRLNETGNNGFEVRSFYKCEEKRDIDKVNENGACIVPIK